MAKKALKQDFGSIFDDNSFDFDDEENVSTLKLTDIEPNKAQPRKNFDLETLKTLSDSIKENGVLQPLLVRTLPDGTYQIVAGERRWRAAKMAGLSEVPVYIRELTDRQAQQIALIENLQRENLNPIEEANGYKELMENYSMTQDEVAKVVGKARSSVANSLRLLSLPPVIAEMVENNELSVGHCKVLLGVKEKIDMVNLAHQAAGKDISVREMERMVKNLDKTKKPEKKKDVFYTEAELCLAKELETRVNIVPGKRKSILQIEFYSNEDLTDIVNKIVRK